MFGVTSYTVRDWLNRAKLDGTKIPGGHWRISGTALTNFAQQEYGNANQ
jgi:hypothetical protein